jgi:hypothetical protein
MFEFSLNNKQYSVRNEWTEIQGDDALYIINLLHRFQEEKKNAKNEEDLFHLMTEVRTLAFLQLSGLKPRRMRNTEQEQFFNENTYRISRELTFLFNIEYKDKAKFNRLSKVDRDLLQHHLPIDLPETQGVKLAKRLKKSVEPNLVFATNLLPEIKIRRRKALKGYSMEVTKGMLTTSLTAGRFIEASEILQQIKLSGNTDQYPLLAAILYSPDPYRSQEAVELTRTLKLTQLQYELILLNFNAVIDYIIRHTKYSILFNSTPAKKSKKHSTGLAGVAYSLTKAGYKDVENQNLLKFFDIQYSELIESVHALSKRDLKPGEISEKTGLSLRIINDILS